ncbi:hypothetical protein J1605_013933 [Eschrichtius robustus]|uniref:Uncharacterized protein n=1 Tax=Eschrichtius robustus TaxID=9764 RepID=A0AB34GG40_ESCRO|nr:hypothetical protein J1605_013933 [Eschrichtius robustus]
MPGEEGLTQERQLGAGGRVAAHSLAGQVSSPYAARLKLLFSEAGGCGLVSAEASSSPFHLQCFPAVPTTKPTGPALTVTDRGLLFGISDLHRLEDLSEGCEQDGESMAAVSLSTSQATGVSHPQKRRVILEGKKPSPQHGAQHSAGGAVEGIQAATKTPSLGAINSLTLLSTNQGAV